jgi:hypothetical protein
MQVHPLYARPPMPHHVHPNARPEQKVRTCSQLFPLEGWCIKRPTWHADPSLAPFPHLLTTSASEQRSTTPHTASLHHQHLGNGFRSYEWRAFLSQCFDCGVFRPERAPAFLTCACLAQFLPANWEKRLSQLSRIHRMPRTLEQ